MASSFYPSQVVLALWGRAILEEKKKIIKKNQCQAYISTKSACLYISSVCNILCATLCEQQKAAV